jgi:hypothetical protein
MVQPFDYSPQVQNPFAGALQAMQLGTAIRDDRAQQAAALAKQQQQEELSRALTEAADDPTPDRIAKLSIRYPQLSENFKRSYDMMAGEAQKSNLSSMTQVYAAVNAEQPEIATRILREQSAAQKAAGQAREAQASETMASLIEKSPQHAKLTIGAALSGIMGPEKFAESFAKLGGEARAQEQAPADLAAKQAGAAKTAAEAKTAEVTAKYADSQAVADLQKKQWDITKITEDIKISKEQNRIRAMEAAASKEGNALKRQELQLKIDEAKRTRDEKIREVAATAEAGASNIDDVVGSFEGRMPETASMLDDQESDAIALINTLGSQAFLAKIPEMKGAGALSNAEGDKLQAALQNLGRAQSEKQFRASLDEASRLLTLGRENLSKKTGIPLQGSGTPAAPGARPPLSSFGGVGGQMIPDNVTIPGR